MWTAQQLQEMKRLDVGSYDGAKRCVRYVSLGIMKGSEQMWVRNVFEGMGWVMGG